ncbi:c-type cytochrome [Ferrovum sp.]|uniref:c-type cytochrome n=1 Tax=Ferrovum sp. TaxID=2609467 RepID=UPI002605D927|nr:c-type cytochrome [Ferrovum sp.]
MKNVKTILTLSALSLALGACSTGITKSRNLGNPNVSGNTLAQQVCSVCHGNIGNSVNGNSVNPTFPNLAGQQKDYLVAQMTAFHEKTRKDPAAQQMMWGIARNFTPKQIDELATFYSNQKPLPNPAHGDAALIAEGQKIFSEGLLDKGVPACMGCHGSNAEGNGVIPRLAGQHANYVYKQLNVFNRDAKTADGKESVPDSELERPTGGVMEMVASGLSDQQKRAMAAYVQSLR